MGIMFAVMEYLEWTFLRNLFFILYVNELMTHDIANIQYLTMLTVSLFVYDSREHPILHHATSWLPAHVAITALYLTEVNYMLLKWHRG